MFLKNLLENSCTKVPRCISISEMLLKNKSVMKSVAAKITIIDEPQPIDLLNLLSRWKDQGPLSLYCSNAKNEGKVVGIYAMISLKQLSLILGEIPSTSFGWKWEEICWENDYVDLKAIRLTMLSVSVMYTMSRRINYAWMAQISSVEIILVLTYISGSFRDDWFFPTVFYLISMVFKNSGLEKKVGIQTSTWDGNSKNWTVYLLHFFLSFHFLKGLHTAKCAAVRSL